MLSDRKRDYLLGQVVLSDMMRMVTFKYKDVCQSEMTWITDLIRLHSHYLMSTESEIHENT